MTLLKRTFSRPSVFILFKGSRGILGPSGPAGTDGAPVSIELTIFRSTQNDMFDLLGLCWLPFVKNIGIRDTQTQTRGCSHDVARSNDAKMKSWQQILQMATILDYNHVSCMASE